MRMLKLHFGKCNVGSSVEHVRKCCGFWYNVEIVDIVSVLNACVGLSEIIHTVFQLLDLRPHYKQDREGGEVGWFKCSGS